MTTIKVNTLKDVLGANATSVTATLKATATKIRESGQNVTFPTVVEATIPQDTLILQEPEPDWAWYIEIFPVGSNPYTAARRGYFRFSGASVDWANMTEVDPENYQALTDYPTVIESLEEISSARDQTVAAAGTVASMVIGENIRRFWAGTQTQYDAVATKNPDTFYIILEG